MWILKPKNGEVFCKCCKFCKPVCHYSAMQILSHVDHLCMAEAELIGKNYYEPSCSSETMCETKNSKNDCKDFRWLTASTHRVA